MTTTSTKLTKVTATELARQLSDILNRIEYRGERFVIERNGKVVATLEPSPSPKQMTFGELLEFLKQLPPLDPEFADELEEILAHQSKTAPPEWE